MTAVFIEKLISGQIFVMFGLFKVKDFECWIQFPYGSKITFERRAKNSENNKTNCNKFLQIFLDMAASKKISKKYIVP